MSINIVLVLKNLKFEYFVNKLKKTKPLIFVHFISKKVLKKYLHILL